jgi:methylenetetrahydrofolate reductase (NADPH)
MALSALWQSGASPTISFEFFPARDDKGAEKLESVINILTDFEPAFTSVTFGAGGSTRQGSFQLVKKLKQEKKLAVVPYLAAWGLHSDQVNAIVNDYRSLQIDGLLCVRGDQPQTESDPTNIGSFPHATDLLGYLKKTNDMILGAAAYPEGHRQAAGLSQDIEFLKLKMEKGARFIITQYTYTNDLHYRFLDRCRQKGIDIPIIIGVMPIYSIKMMESLAALCGATISKGVRDGLAKIPPDDKRAVTEFGVQFALAQCRDLIQHGVQGIHFYTMDRARTVGRILTALHEEGLLPGK